MISLREIASRINQNHSSEAATSRTYGRDVGA
jgi:hypothetical protein